MITFIVDGSIMYTGSIAGMHDKFSSLPGVSDLDSILVAVSKGAQP
jgi:hypothetical protein